MKANTKTTEQGQRRAYSMIEVLGVMGVLAVVVAGGLAGFGNPGRGAKETRLQAQVRQLNAAAAVYESNGGSLEGIGTAEGALAKMRTVASAATRDRIAGLRGSVIDAGLRAVMLTASEALGSEARAVWVPTKRRFEMAASGMGVKSFEIDPDLALVAREEEDRSASLLLATNGGWVWDYQDFEGDRSGRLEVALLGETGSGRTGSPYPEALRLNPPVFSVPGGSYDYSEFNMAVYLTNENPTAASRILYSLGDDVWREYDGGAILVGPNAQLTAYAVARDPESWMDSERESAVYRSTFRISGEAGGIFANAEGGDRMVTGGEGTLFTWGSASGTPDPSWLLFHGASFLDVNPDERFLLGEISYYNGTIVSGTGADSVDLDIALAFGGTSLAHDFQYTLELINTPNLEGNTLDQSADFVRFGNIRSETPMTLGGVDYTLLLEFGETTANGFSTIDQFFVHENRMATGRLYGTLVVVPVEEDDASGAEDTDGTLAAGI